MDHQRISQQALCGEVPGFKRDHVSQGQTEEGFMKNGTQVWRGVGSSPQQTTVASECGPVRSHRCGINQG